LNQKLYDRKSQRSNITATINNLSYGKKKLILLEGELGSGKTHLLHWCVQNYSEYFILFENSSKVFKCVQADKFKVHELTSSIYDYLFSINENIQHDVVGGTKEIHTLTPFWRSILAAAEKMPMVGEGVKLYKTDIESTDELINKVRTFFSEYYMQKTFFSPLLNAVKKMFKTSKKVFIAIDDIHWLDHNSLNVLLKLISKLQEDQFQVCLFATLDILSEDKKHNEDILREHFDNENYQRIILNPLDYDEFKDVIKEAKKELTDDVQYFFHKKTSGNFEEIHREVLTQFDSTLNSKFVNAQKDSANSYISQETMYFHTISTELSYEENKVLYFLLFKLNGIVHIESFKLLYRLFLDSVKNFL
jgi:predicted ATPase